MSAPISHLSQFVSPGSAPNTLSMVDVDKQWEDD